MTIEQFVAEIREKCAKATPGPSTTSSRPTIAELEAILADDNPVAIEILPSGEIREVLDAASFEAYARTALPRAAEIIEAQAAMVEHCLQEIDANESCANEAVRVAGLLGQKLQNLLTGEQATTSQEKQKGELSVQDALQSKTVGPVWLWGKLRWLEPVFRLRASTLREVGARESRKIREVKGRMRGNASRPVLPAETKVTEG